MNVKKVISVMKQCVAENIYMHFYKKEVDNRIILVESKKGFDMGGNMFFILKELCKPEYADYQVFVSADDSKKNDIEKILANGNITCAAIVKTAGAEYCRLLGLAKYLFTDTTFPKMFIKKSRQVLVNTWHGTPLKKMGRDCAGSEYNMGNVQRTFLMSDYLVFPNEFMREKMVEAYGLKGTFKGKILCEGYPRNSVLISGCDIQIDEIKGKRVYAYMPTWRGTTGNVDSDSNIQACIDFLGYMDSNLEDDELLYVRLHPFVSKTVSLKLYKHIKPFPENCHPYEFLSKCDGLVTDFSSVMFDWAVSKKSCVLYTYDLDEYVSSRGLYLNPLELPFHNYVSVKNVLKALRKGKDYDDEKLLKTYCTYDNEDATSRLLRHCILGEDCCKELDIYNPEQKNVLIYAGTLAQNGLTSALINELAMLRNGKYNYYITFREQALTKEPERLGKIDKRFMFVPICDGNRYTIGELVAYCLYFKANISIKPIVNKLRKMYRREWKRFFGGIHYTSVVQYTGYEYGMINLFESFRGNNTIFVHSDMLEEMKLRHNQHYNTLKSAYSNYKHVAVITGGLAQGVEKISGRSDNICVVENCHDYKTVQAKSEMEIQFQDSTQCNISIEELVEILHSPLKKIITVGRFSPEKDHKRLIDVFSRYYQDNQSYLIIIGGRGELYDETLRYAQSLDCAENIILIKSMLNPMPVLKMCDLFVLPSHYEGLGLVMLEADTLGLPVFSTDTVGPRYFLSKYHGLIVEDSEEGIMRGFNEFKAGHIYPLNVDYEEYNQNAVNQFIDVTK